MLPIRRPRLRKSWKRCARSAPSRNPQFVGRHGLDPCRPVEDSCCGAEQGAFRFELAVPQDGILKVDVLRSDISKGRRIPVLKVRKKKQNDFASDSQFAIHLRIAFFLPRLHRTMKVSFARAWLPPLILILSAVNPVRATDMDMAEMLKEVDSATQQGRDLDARAIAKKDY